MAGVVFLLDPASPVTIISAFDLVRVGQRLLDLRARSRLFLPGTSMPVSIVPLLVGFRSAATRLAVYQTDVAVVPGSVTQPDFISRLGWDILSRWHIDLDATADTLVCDIRASDFSLELPPR